MNNGETPATLWACRKEFVLLTGNFWPNGSVKVIFPSVQNNSFNFSILFSDAAPRIDVMHFGSLRWCRGRACDTNMEAIVLNVAVPGRWPLPHVFPLSVITLFPVNHSQIRPMDPLKNVTNSSKCWTCPSSRCRSSGDLKRKKMQLCELVPLVVNFPWPHWNQREHKARCLH